MIKQPSQKSAVSEGGQGAGNATFTPQELGLIAAISEEYIGTLKSTSEMVPILKSIKSKCIGWG